MPVGCCYLQVALGAGPELCGSAVTLPRSPSMMLLIFVLPWFVLSVNQAATVSVSFISGT
jgi:hypothetical protein